MNFQEKLKFFNNKANENQKISINQNDKKNNLKNSNKQYIHQQSNKDKNNKQKENKEKENKEKYNKEKENKEKNKNNKEKENKENKIKEIKDIKDIKDNKVNKENKENKVKEIKDIKYNKENKEKDNKEKESIRIPIEKSINKKDKEVDIIRKEESKKETTLEIMKNFIKKKSRNVSIKRARVVYENNNINININNTFLDLNPISIDNLNKIENLDEFDELKYKNRKYNKYNINNGKQFFKLRFIKRNLGKKTIKASSSASNFFSQKKKVENELTLSNLEKEKNFRVHNSNFLLIIEKVILSFNQKNFKESYNLLLSSEIISSLKEFGEFLLTVNGFDKSLIGEFLSKDKPPNEKGEVLKYFMGSINLKHSEISLLESIRFLLSRINLPKDANLILTIMESFTNYFFKVNENNKEFKNIFGNTDNIYLLISSLLALNTMFTRTDIKNMNLIKKEEFINMNSNVKDDYLNDLYDKIKNQPITMSDDYSEIMYQKLTPLVSKKTNRVNIIKNNIKSENKKNNKEIIDTNVHFDDLKNKDIVQMPNYDNFTLDDEEFLCNKKKFYKISGTKIPSLYEILVINNCTKIVWDKKIDFININKCHYLNIKDINEVYNGIDICEHSSNIKKYIKANPTEEKFIITFISISYCNNKESLDLKCDDIDLTLKWFKALKSLINKMNNEDLQKRKSINDEQIKEKESIKNEIWDKYILQKWDKYGNYLIFKLQERANFYNYLKNDLRQSTKKLEISEEKKSINYINTFFYNLKQNLSKRDMEINEFYTLCNFGFPFFLRNKLWRILIGNQYFITDNLYNSIKNKINKTDLNLNFEDLEKKYKNNNNKNICFNKDEKLNKIILDILSVKSIFLDDILERNIDQYNLMWSVYKIIRVLLLFRNDIVYNIIFVEIIYLFSIVEEREEIAFSNIVNFLFNNNSIKLLIGNEKFRKDMTNKNINFFKKLIKNKIPNIDEHLSHLEIIPELYFIPWMDELYIKVLNINILLQVFDLYLLNGEYILFQTGVAILKILEDEITNMTISQVLKSLKRLPDKYKKEKFFEVFYNLNGIKSDYVEWNRQNELMWHKYILIND